MARSRNIVQLRAEVRQRADMVNSAFVTDFDVDLAILQSCAQLYDEMCATGEDYFIKYVDITAPNGGFFDFASWHASDGYHATDVYQVRGVDAVYGDNVVVNLPGVKDQQRALDIIGRQGEVLLRPVLQVGTTNTDSTTTTVAGSTETTTPDTVAPAQPSGPGDARRSVPKIGRAHV